MFVFVNEYPINAAGPEALHGCFICHAPKRNAEERLVDLGVVTDEIHNLDGEVYGFKKVVICENCVLELADMFGCLLPRPAERLANSHAAQAVTIEQQANELLALQDLRKVAQRIAS